MEKGLRHEYKYLISKADAELLKLRLPHIMQRDPHAGETGCYTIRSLYFDDVNAAAYYEKMDGKAQPHVFSVLDPFSNPGKTANSAALDFYQQAIENKVTN